MVRAYRTGPTLFRRKFFLDRAYTVRMLPTAKVGAKMAYPHLYPHQKSFIFLNTIRSLTLHDSSKGLLAAKALISEVNSKVHWELKFLGIRNTGNTFMAKTFIKVWTAPFKKCFSGSIVIEIPRLHIPRSTSLFLPACKDLSLPIGHS
jgi:hypothetical protein